MTILQYQLMDRLLREDTLLFDEVTADLCEAVCGLEERGLATYNGRDMSLSLSEGGLQEWLRHG